MKSLGDLLMVDLTTGKISIERFPVEWIHQYLGGRGVNSYLLYKGLEEKNISPF